MPATPEIRLDHVGIAVRSIPDAEPVLSALGCERTHREVGPDGTFVWATYEFRAGSASRLELVAPVGGEGGGGGGGGGDGGTSSGAGGDGPIAAFLAEHGPGLHHVTLETDDVDAAIAAVEAADVEAVDYAEHDGWTEAFVSPRNPTGALFQLMEYHDGYAEDRGGPEHAYVGGERLGAGDERSTGDAGGADAAGTDVRGTDAAAVDAEGVDGGTVERIGSDPYCARLGVRLRSIGPGRATTELEVAEGLTNFHGTPHGGAVYSVADAAFAAASNSHGEPAVALETNVSYLAAADVGETLVARAEETHRTRRTAEYEVVVRAGREEDDGGDGGDDGAGVGGDDDDDDRGDRPTPEGGERIATFRGRVYLP